MELRFRGGEREEEEGKIKRRWGRTKKKTEEKRCNIENIYSRRMLKEERKEEKRKKKKS